MHRREEGLRHMAWWERAACIGWDTNHWYPTQGESNAVARSVCASCPVNAETWPRRLPIP